MIKVLFISQWYPHRYDKMFGLFVQKHAEAVSLFCDVRVLYVQPDEKIDTLEIVNNTQNKLTEKIVYFPVNTRNKFHKFIKVFSYLNAYYKGYKELLSEDFVPDIVHANILTRTGFIAYLLKLTNKTPYIITEHWSRYLANRNSYHGTLRKIVTKIVVKNASAILPVSANLKDAMLAHQLKNSNYIVVNNVVDDPFFMERQATYHTKKRILHISCFDEAAKNVKGLLRATRELSKIRQDFELCLIGTGIDFEEVLNYSKSLNFPKDTVLFLGEKTPEEVAISLYNSDFFVLFSNYENSPVVISESLVCGKPIVSSNVGGISEHVNDTNGILVESGNENELLDKLNYMLDNFQNYNSVKIKKEAKLKFSYENVGNRIFNIYKSII